MHSKNALSQILITDEGIIISSKLEHFEKDEFPIIWTEEGRVIEKRLMQLLKRLSTIIVLGTDHKSLKISLFSLCTAILIGVS